MTIQSLQNPKRRVIAVPATGNTPVLVSVSIIGRYMEVAECPPQNFDNNTNPYNPQGILYQLADENYATTYALLPGSSLSFGDRNFPRDKARGVPQRTDPAGNTILATPVVKLVSATATATQVEVDEWN
jgi:hypothetical protein